MSGEGQVLTSDGFMGTGPGASDTGAKAPTAPVKKPGKIVYAVRFAPLAAMEKGSVRHPSPEKKSKSVMLALKNGVYKLPKNLSEAHRKTMLARFIEMGFEDISYVENEEVKEKIENYQPIKLVHPEHTVDNPINDEDWETVINSEAHHFEIVDGVVDVTSYLEEIALTSRGFRAYTAPTGTGTPDPDPDKTNDPDEVNDPDETDPAAGDTNDPAAGEGNPPEQE